MFPKIVGFPSKSSILIGFSIIFTIHFGVPPFLETPIWFSFGKAYVLDHGIQDPQNYFVEFSVDKRRGPLIVVENVVTL